jgi:hypothetical protein
VADCEPVPLPTAGAGEGPARFSVRQNSAIWFDGTYYLYADVVPWDNPFHPDTYDTSIHLFTSADAEEWKYEGEVLPKGPAGSWTAAGIATPGACVFGNQIYLSYSVRGNADGSGHRFIGIAVADDPRGPFRELPQLRLIPDDVDYSRDRVFLLLDDPQLVASNAAGTGPGEERLDLYYRRSLNDFAPRDHGGNAVRLEYDIRTRQIVDIAKGWGDPHILIPAVSGGIVETADVRWIGQRLVMIVLGYGEGEMAIYLSNEGRTFVPAEPHLLEKYLDIFMPAACFRLPGFIQGPDGVVSHMTTPGDIDDEGHYTQWVFRITCD